MTKKGNGRIGALELTLLAAAWLLILWFMAITFGCSMLRLTENYPPVDEPSPTTRPAGRAKPTPIRTVTVWMPWWPWAKKGVVDALASFEGARVKRTPEGVEVNTGGMRPLPEEKAGKAGIGWLMIFGGVVVVGGLVASKWIGKAGYLAAAGGAGVLILAYSLGQAPLWFILLIVGLACVVLLVYLLFATKAGANVRKWFDQMIRGEQRFERDNPQTAAGLVAAQEAEQDEATKKAIRQAKANGAQPK